MNGRVALAAAALLLALGLPWGVVGAETEYVAGWMNPSYCIATWDGYLDCTYGYISPGFVIPGQGAAYAGYQTSARVTIVLGGALLLHWSRNGGRWQLPSAALLQVGAVALAGSALRPGAVAALIAAALLLAESGLLRGRSLPRSGGDDRMTRPFSSA
ncbi:hypothetical protein [Pseudactinotalea suaedae]|uniref:hypothetical protein n=1 Tax=Pseudactinotalea suaedae TaxID=1524924 RepID=UPI0012E1F34D|nr:hypothetical protein [Pseudactinotalea suaedae]